MYSQHAKLLHSSGIQITVCRDFISPPSPNMKVIYLIFIGSTVELSLCWFSLETYEMLATRNKEENSYWDSRPDLSLALKSN